jgi:hypothetical protein
MAPPARTYQSKRPTPAEQAEGFKQAQEQMKEDAARRRAEAEKAAKGDKPRRRT